MGFLAPGPGLLLPYPAASALKLEEEEEEEGGTTAGERPGMAMW